MYVLFRVLDAETVVHVINKNNDAISLDLNRFSEIKLNGKTLKNIISNSEFVWENNLVLNERGSFIWTTKK